MHPTRTYDYLVKSRAMLLDWVRPLTHEQYTAEHPIGLATLARTLHHTMAAEWNYMQRINGRTEPLGERAPAHDPEASPPFPFPDLESAWGRLATQTRADLAALLEARVDWHEPLTYRTVLKSGPATYDASRSDMFTQLALHEVHHRAQALNMLRRLGVETGELDFNSLMFLPGHP
jgi:uncharacterized damage-inducible protein DinB